jgi:hypothetical protein
MVMIVGGGGGGGTVCTTAVIGGIGWSRGEESAIEGVEAVEGGDGHCAGGDTQVEVKDWRISTNPGLSAGSCLQHSSTMSQIG